MLMDTNIAGLTYVKNYGFEHKIGQYLSSNAPNMLFNISLFSRYALSDCLS